MVRSRSYFDGSKRAAPSKPKATKPMTTRIPAAALAEQHQFTKQGQEMFEDLIGMITKHLKKGERVKIAGLGILQVRKRAARMGRTRPPAKRSRSRLRRGRLPRRQGSEDGDLIGVCPRRSSDSKPRRSDRRGFVRPLWTRACGRNKVAMPDPPGAFFVSA